MTAVGTGGAVTCAFCKGLFQPKKGQTARRFCSRTCQAKAAYRRAPSRPEPTVTIILTHIDAYWAAVARGAPST